jgi:hypothetical protein
MLSGHALTSLPPGLKTLDTVLNVNAEDLFVPFLPRSLIHLELRGMTTFNDSSVEFLPRGLRNLCLRHVAHGLTDLCISSLPKNLHSLHLEHNQTLTPEALLACPLPHLADVDIRANPNFTKKRVLQCAPSTLRIKGKKIHQKLMTFIHPLTHQKASKLV